MVFNYVFVLGPLIPLIGVQAKKITISWEVACFYIFFLEYKGLRAAKERKSCNEMLLNILEG